jgi:hypothetical protein
MIIAAAHAGAETFNRSASEEPVSSGGIVPRHSQSTTGRKRKSDIPKIVVGLEKRSDASVVPSFPDTATGIVERPHSTTGIIAGGRRRSQISAAANPEGNYDEGLRIATPIRTQECKIAVFFCGTTALAL